MKKPSPSTRARLLLLCEMSRDKPFAEARAAEFESMLAAEPDLLRDLAETLLVDAELRHDPRLLRELVLAPPVTPPRNLIPILALAAAACVFLGLLVFQTIRQVPLPVGPAAVATLTQSTNCKWGGSTLPTAEGVRVSAGSLELVEGLATILFDSGAEITLEGPAVLDIVDPMNARLVHGTLVAEVPKAASGFTIDTKDATFVDIGTRFGLSTSDDGRYLVQVLEGTVEVKHKGETHSRRVTTGKNLDRGLLHEKIRPSSPPAEPKRWRPDADIATADGWQIVSTSFGRGKDTYVSSSPDAGSFGKDPFFRVKHSSIQPDLVRVGYLGFDLSAIDPSAIADSELVLSIEASDLGFASLVPDCTFTVYGLTDETLDDWDEHELKWRNAPALGPEVLNPARPDPGKAVRLGQFTIPRGVQRGTRAIAGRALTEFLKKDSNRIATLLVFRETDESARTGLVHAFSSKENSHNPPPLLRLKTAPSIP